MFLTLQFCFLSSGYNTSLVRKKRSALFKNILDLFTGRRKRPAHTRPKASSYNPPRNPPYTTSKPSYETPLSPPPQLYGVRMRQRQDYPCDDPRYRRLCANHEAQGFVVECGEQRRFR